MIDVLQTIGWPANPPSTKSQRKMEIMSSEPEAASQQEVRAERTKTGKWLPGHRAIMPKNKRIGISQIGTRTRRKILEYLGQDVELACQMAHNDLLHGNTAPYMLLAKLFLPRQTEEEGTINLKALVIESASAISLDAMRADLIAALERKAARQAVPALASGGGEVYPLEEEEPEDAGKSVV